MKIYTPCIRSEFKPSTQNYVWPPQNRAPGQDYGVEQDFERWLLAHPELSTRDPAAADWMYLSIYWNRSYINLPDEDGHWGMNQEARTLLQEEVNRLRYNGLRRFTITEGSLRGLMPWLDLQGIVTFCSSRREAHDETIDIPLLSAPHRIQGNVDKRHLAVFLGNLETDGMRIDMARELQGRPGCRLEHTAAYSPDDYARAMQEAFIALCPRGQGAQSYRMYEAMALGIVPLYISDLDCRPFKRWIDWEECSIWTRNATGLNILLDGYSDRLNDLHRMGNRATTTYRLSLQYGAWCPFVLRELEALS